MSLSFDVLRANTNVRCLMNHRQNSGHTQGRVRSITPSRCLEKVCGKGPRSATLKRCDTRFVFYLCVRLKPTARARSPIHCDDRPRIVCLDDHRGRRVMALCSFDVLGVKENMCYLIFYALTFRRWKTVVARLNMYTPRL